MKNFISVLISITVFIFLTNCNIAEQVDSGKEIQPALPLIQDEIRLDLNNFYIAVQDFNLVTNKNKFNSEISDQEYKSYKELRKAFKTVEFIIEYFDPQFYNQKVNGAPLPKLTPKDTDINIIYPKGIQVMDEIMYADMNTKNHTELAKQANLLENNLKGFQQTIGNSIINQRQIFEAIRYNLIRQASLSITGFDTPGSLLGLEDAENEIKSNKKYIAFFKDELYALNQGKLYELGQSTFIEAENFIHKPKDFNQFDRLTYIQQFINPLYGLIKQIHYASGYETWEETDLAQINTLNYNAENLFSNNFLDKFAFVSQENDSLYNKRTALGKILFYDPLLSSSSELACVSCHHPDKAFTDAQPKSIGTDGLHTVERNSMALPYSVYSKKMFWDLRVSSLENQFEHVIVSDKEFHTSYIEIVNKLRSSEKYKQLFTEAFPNAYTQALSINSIDYALAAYVMNLGKYNTKFDGFMRNENSLNPKEIEGFNLFAGKAACATCHFIPTFSGLVPPFYKESESEVLGITTTDTEPWALDEDLGRFAGLIKESADFYKYSFKTVTVRNIEKTAPFMHNGAFKSLESLMDFYNDGGGAGRGLPVTDQTLAPDPLELTEDEIENVIAFMKTLNDLEQPIPVTNQQLPRDFKNDKWNKRVIPYVE